MNAVVNHDEQRVKRKEKPILQFKISDEMTAPIHPTHQLESLKNVTEACDQKSVYLLTVEDEDGKKIESHEIHP